MVDLNQSMVDVLTKHNLLSKEQTENIDGLDILRNAGFSITESTLNTLNFEAMDIQKLAYTLETKSFSTKVMNKILSYKSIASNTDIIEALLGSTMNDYVSQLLEQHENAHDVFINIVEKYINDWDDEDYEFGSQQCRTISDLIQDLVFTQIEITPKLIRAIINSGYIHALSNFADGIQYEHNYEEIKAVLVEVLNDKTIIEKIVLSNANNQLISRYSTLENITQNISVYNGVVAIVSLGITYKNFTLQDVTEYLLESKQTDLLFKILIRNKSTNVEFVENFIEEYKSKFSTTKNIIKLSSSEYEELLTSDIINPEIVLSTKLLEHFKPSYIHIPSKHRRLTSVIDYYLENISGMVYKNYRIDFVSSIVLDKKLRGIYFKCLDNEIIKEYIHSRDISPVVLDILITEFGEKVKMLIDVDKLVGMK